MTFDNVTYLNTATGKARQVNIPHIGNHLKDILQTNAKGQKAGGIPFPLKELLYAAPVLPLANINLTGGMHSKDKRNNKTSGCLKGILRGKEIINLLIYKFLKV